MMLDIIMRVTFLPVQKNTQLLVLYARILTKMNIADQKVQVADEIKRDIWKYLVSSDVADDAWYNNMCNISFYAKISSN